MTTRTLHSILDCSIVWSDGPVPTRFLNLLNAACPHASLTSTAAHVRHPAFIVAAPVLPPILPAALTHPAGVEPAAVSLDLASRPPLLMHLPPARRDIHTHLTPLPSTLAPPLPPPSPPAAPRVPLRPARGPANHGPGGPVGPGGQPARLPGARRGGGRGASAGVGVGVGVGVGGCRRLDGPNGQVPGAAQQ